MTTPTPTTRSRAELQRHVDRLATIVWNHGADVEGPYLAEYDDGDVAFAVSGGLPGPDRPRAAELILREKWTPLGADRFRRIEYQYELLEPAFSRRRAFHAHDRSYYVGEFDVATHEHCETTLGDPDCEHYYGLPVDAYEAIRQFSILWAQPESFDCSELRCIE